MLGKSPSLGSCRHFLRAYPVNQEPAGFFMQLIKRAINLDFPPGLKIILQPLTIFDKLRNPECGAFERPHVRPLSDDLRMDV